MIKQKTTFALTSCLSWWWILYNGYGPSISVAFAMQRLPCFRRKWEHIPWGSLLLLPLFIISLLLVSYDIYSSLSDLLSKNRSSLQWIFLLFWMITSSLSSIGKVWVIQRGLGWKSCSIWCTTEDKRIILHPKVFLLSQVKSLIKEIED